MSSKNSRPQQFSSLKEAIADIKGRDVQITSSLPLSGGDINDAFKLTLSDGGSLFLKKNSRNNLSFFSCEMGALREMERVGEIGIPHALGRGVEGSESFLLLEFIESAPMRGNYWEDFGRSLARFHLAGRGAQFGFFEDNYIGSTLQKNDGKESWVDFFRENRLDYQARLASNYMGGSLARAMISFLDRLENYLPEPEYPSLIHGDLWSGNVLCGPDGKAWIIDPAAYYGHGEADLAMTELFGKYPEAFYSSYSNENPIDPEYEDRKDIYNLYHLLNHLNMFGSSYLGSVRTILNRFV